MLECEHWQQIYRDAKGFFLWGKTTLSVWMCVCKTRQCVCMCLSEVCNLCFLCLLPGCDAEGRCDGNLPLFKSTAGTSKAAAGITEIIRHKHLIYIKMLINLSSLSSDRLRWPCVLYSISVCVIGVCLCVSVCGHTHRHLFGQLWIRSLFLRLSFCVWSDWWALSHLSLSKIIVWIPSSCLNSFILKRQAFCSDYTNSLCHTKEWMLQFMGCLFVS